MSRKIPKEIYFNSQSSCAEKWLGFPAKYIKQLKNILEDTCSPISMVSAAGSVLT